MPCGRLEALKSLEHAFPQPGPLYPIQSWTGVPPDVAEAEINGLVVRDFAPLLALKKLRALRVNCACAKQFEIVGKLRGLRPREFERLREARLASP